MKVKNRIHDRDEFVQQPPDHGLCMARAKGPRKGGKPTRADRPPGPRNPGKAAADSRQTRQTRDRDWTGAETAGGEGKETQSLTKVREEPVRAGLLAHSRQKPAKPGEQQLCRLPKDWLGRREETHKHTQTHTHTHTQKKLKHTNNQMK